MDKTSLSALRFLGVIIVVLFHNRKGSEALQGVLRILTAGPEMVTFFYVLSGFVLIVAYYHRQPFVIMEFVVKRTARIIPIYLISLFLSLLTILLAHKKIDPTALFLHLSLLQAWFPPYPLSINPPAWFLSGLVFFYLTFPWVLSQIKNFKLSPAVVLVSAFILWLTTQIVLTLYLNNGSYRGFPSTSHDIVNYFPLSHYCSFLLGCSVGYMFIANEKIIIFVKNNSLLFRSASCFILIFLVQYEQNISRFVGVSFPYGSSFFAPIFSLLILSFSVGRSLKSKFYHNIIVLLGNVSFIIYIMQRPVRFLLEYSLRGIFLNKDLFLVVFVLLLIFISVVLYYLVEKPISDKVSAAFVAN